MNLLFQLGDKLLHDLLSFFVDMSVLFQLINKLLPDID